MTLTSTGVFCDCRDNDSSVSGSSKTLEEKETHDCHIREKERSLLKNSQIMFEESAVKLMLDMK